MRIWWITPLFLALAACPPSRRGADDDDATDNDDIGDDDVGDDDDIGDDDVADDDDLAADDDSWIGDDDVDDPMCSPAILEPASTIETTLPAQFWGAWVAGELSYGWDSGMLTLITETGEAFEFRATSGPDPLYSLGGAARVLFDQPDPNRPEFSAFAAEADAGWTRVYSSRSTWVPARVTESWGLFIEPMFGFCPELWDDDCGLFQAMPVLIEWADERTAFSAILGPGMTEWSPEGLSTISVLRSQEYVEDWCGLPDALDWSVLIQPAAFDG